MIASPVAWPDAVGWALLAALTALFVVQSRVLRAFSRPRHQARHGWPSISVLITSSGTPSHSGTREIVSALSDSRYAGELAIWLEADAPEHMELAKQLTIAAPRIRIETIAATAAEGAFATFLKSAPGELVLILPSTIRLEADAIERLVSEALDDPTLAALVLLPRLELRLTEILVEPLLPWMHLTVSPLLASRRTEDHFNPSLRRLGSSNSVVRYVDGYDSATRSALGRESLGKALREAVGSSRPRRLAAVTLLVVLFVVPPLVALVTQSFPWIVGAVVSYWMRLRVAARTGEPFPGVLLHPLAVLAAAFELSSAPGRAASLRKSVQDDDVNDSKAR